ncbi:MAG: argininosuccinate lyase [Thermoanaerobaculia bacterium]
MSTLWSPPAALDELVARLTAGTDPELDVALVPYDALASAAHARMLTKIGVLTAAECDAILDGLRKLAREARDLESGFEILASEEDGHTAIENRLTATLGDAGKKIHTGRSRNDQVIAALRLWSREAVLTLARELLETSSTLTRLAGEHAETSMPGYTHTRQAMPTTLGHFFAAAADTLLDEMPWLRAAFEHVNRSPLGSASGFGVALDLDRDMVSEELGFSGVQRNTLAVQNDRGRSESLVLAVAASVATDLGRLSADLIRFSSEEAGFLTLGPTTTTGSSIMPQKRNPDVLEIIRSSATRCRALQSEVAGIYGGLGFGYHRDLQLTKEPLLRGVALATDCAAALGRLLESLQVDAETCRNAVLPSTAATDAVYRRVGQGEPFRDAYRATAADPETAYAGDPAESWRARTHTGAPGDRDLDYLDGALASEREWVETKVEATAAVWRSFERNRSE